MFRATSALDRGFLKIKKGGKLSVHYNGDLSTAELLFRTIISVNQFSVDGALADWCGELAQQISDHAFTSTEKPVANMHDESECRISPSVVSILTNPLSTHVQVQGDLLRNQNKRFEEFPEDTPSE